MVKFQREKMGLRLMDDLRPLIEKHYREIAHYQDIPLAPNWDLYVTVEEQGSLRVYTIREITGDRVAQIGNLLGYAIFIVKHNLHYRTSLQAAQDVLFLEADCRKSGLGAEFIFWCDEQLRQEGVQAVFHHVKSKANFGPKILIPLGYEEIDVIYGRRLDK